MINLKVKLSKSIGIGGIMAARKYLKETQYSKWEIENATREIARKRGVSTVSTLEIDLTLYESIDGGFETVVFVVGKGSESNQPVKTWSGFYELYYTYEKAANDPQAIFNYYTLKETQNPPQ